jgi:hypothetical protein
MGGWRSGRMDDCWRDVNFTLMEENVPLPHCLAVVPRAKIETTWNIAEDRFHLMSWNIDLVNIYV